MAVISTIPRGDVDATLTFYRAPEDGATPYNLVAEELPQGQARRNYGENKQPVTIHDARGRESDFNLDNDAFQFVLDVPPSEEVEFVDDESIKAKYYPEVEKLLLDQIPGSNEIYIFDHTVRRAAPGSKRTPVHMVHIDQTAASAAKRVERYYAPEKAAALLKTSRYRIVNVWRPLNPTPIEASPLAVASSASVLNEDVVPVEHIYADGYRGQTAAIKHNPSQDWYYLSGMTGNERLLLECFDSASLKEGSPIRGRVPHTAFTDPRTRVDAEGRESIEVRALVFGV